MPTLPPITTTNINGHSYAQADWEANIGGTISSIANDIAAIVAAASLVGVLAKAITGSVTLSGTESTNIGFVFSGALTADATITWAAGFKGVAQVVNNTTGGHNLICGLASGAKITVPYSATLFCDGANFILINGIEATATQAKTLTDLVVGGAVIASAGVSGTTGTFTGTVSTGALSPSSVAATGNGSFGGTLSATGAATFGSTASFTGAVTMNSTLTVSGLGTFNNGATVFNNFINKVTGAGLVAYFEADAAKSCQVAWATGFTDRWRLGRNSTAESGSNVGSDLDFDRYDDSGTHLGTPIRIRRSDGVIIMGSLPTVATGVAGGLWNNAGVLNVG